MGLLMFFVKARAGIVGVCAIACMGPVSALRAEPQQPPGQVQGNEQSTPSVQAKQLPPDSARAGQNSQAPPPIEFESHGMQYEALTREGITVMFASIPPHIKDYNVVQITVTNGSPVPWTVKPADFSFIRRDGTVFSAVSADEVVASLLQKAGRNDVIKLRLLYEESIYSLSNYRSTNGYEQRREAAMAQFVNARFKAAAAASAITLVATKLNPGDSTDGAVFFENRTKAKSLGSGRLVAHTCGQKFVFEVYSEPKLRQ
jgi:hypothetical protein